MKNDELQKLWLDQNQKIDSLLIINKELALNLSRQKLAKQINRLCLPKWMAVAIGIPYTILLGIVALIAFTNQAYLVFAGFAIITLIMFMVLVTYFHQLYLISQVKKSEAVLSTQKQLASLRLSSIKSISMAVFQLPFWSVCWVSIEALKDNPLFYGGIHLLAFILLWVIAYWMYQELNTTTTESKIRDLFFSGVEWEAIIKSEEILKQIKDYESL